MPSRRNLYLIKGTLESFGKVQLPSYLDVLRNIIYYRVVQGEKEWGACCESACELEALCIGRGIPSLTRKEMNDIMRVLYQEYAQLLNLSIKVNRWTAAELDEHRTEVINFCRRERALCTRLNQSFPIWRNRETIVDELRQAGWPEKAIRDFEKEIADRNYRLVDYELNSRSDQIFDRMRAKKAQSEDRASRISRL